MFNVVDDYSRECVLQVVDFSIIDEFLSTQESVLIRWSDADQNFVIVEYN